GDRAEATGDIAAGAEAPARNSGSPRDGGRSSAVVSRIPGGCRARAPLMDALVTGGTGFVGANLVRELLADGRTVRVLARPGSDRRALEGCRVEIAEGDLLDRDSLRAAVAGARRVYHVAADYRLWARDSRALYRAHGADDRGFPQGQDGGLARHRAEHRPRARRRAGPHPGRRSRQGGAEVRPGQSEHGAHRDLPRPCLLHGRARPAVPRPLRCRLARRFLHGERGAGDGGRAGGGPRCRAHGAQAHVLQRGQGRARARPAPDACGRRPAGRRHLVRGARLRSAARQGRMNATKFVSRITRKSRSNFFFAFLTLPRPQREAIYAVYAFCRIVDDAVDLGQDRAAQRGELARWREEIRRVYEGTPEHPAAERLQEAVKLFPIPRSALLEIIAGVEMDLGRSTYETFEDLY